MSDSTILTTFLVITGVLALGILITNIVFSFKYEPYDFGNNTIIEKIEKDLNSGLIDTLEFKPTCTASEEEVILEKWDGTPDVCICNGKETPCDQKKDNCEVRKGIPARNFTIFNGNKICIKRSNDRYIDLIKNNRIIPKNKDCPNNYKSCGIVDTLERKLCVDKNEDCPINSFNISSKNDSNEQLYKDHHSLDLGNGYNLYFLNEPENDNTIIISNLKISIGYPCIDVSQRTWNTYLNENKKKNEKCYTEIKGEIYDKRYVEFSNFKTNYLRLYQDNNLYNYITDELREDDSVITLYGRPYYGVDTSGDSFDYSKIISIQDTSNTCNEVMRIVSYIMIGVVLTPIFGACGGAAGGDCSSSSAEVVIVVFVTIIIVIILIGFLIHFVVCIIIYISIQRLKWILVDNSKMVDEYTNELFKLLIDSYSSNYNYALGIIIVITLMFACGIVALVLHFRSKKLKLSF